MKKILCIGNSFSQDASRYVWGISRADGQEIKIVNLYIGGCDFARHFRNMLSENRAYAFEINGMVRTGIKVSLKEALLMEDWDFITFQQHSLQAADYETYRPYLDRLVEYVRQLCPKAKHMVFQTWGYEEGSKKLQSTPFSSHKDMFLALKKGYAEAKEGIGADGLIPGGEAIYAAVERNLPNIYRDSFHMSLGFGRYLLGLLFFGTMIGEKIEDNAFCDFDEPMTEEEIRAAKEIAVSVLYGNTK